MAFFPEEVIEEVASRNDIVDVISSYVKLTKRGSNYVGLCPFHNEKTPSFSVSSQKQLYYCFGCRESGNIYTFLMRYENMSFPEAVTELAMRGGYELPKINESNSKVSDEKNRILLIQKKAAEYYYRMLRSDEGKDALNYFLGRRLSAKTLNTFGLGYTGKRGNLLYKYLKEEGFDDSILKKSGLVIFDETKGARDRFWNRAMFPIMDTNKKVIAFGGRVMGDAKPKYLNSPETDIFDKSRTLYGLHLAKKTRREQFILCEGYMDVISLHQAGFDSAIATLGTALTQKHAEVLRRYKKPVYLCYDSDQAGQNAIIRGFKILREVGIESKVISLSPYKDPDEFIIACGMQAFEERIKEAKNTFIYIMHLAKSSMDENDPASVTNFQNRLTAELLTFEDEMERTNYIRSCANEFGISFEALQTRVNRIGVSTSASSVQKSYLKNKMVKAKPNDGMLDAQKLFLQMILDYRVYLLTSKIITPSDFVEGVLREAASEIYTQMETKKEADISAIVNKFDEPSDQKLISGIFFSAEANQLDEKNLEKAAKEVMARIKKHSIELERSMADPSDVKVLQEIIDRERELLKQIEQLDFSNIVKKG